MSEEGQLYELTKKLVEQITGRYTENIQDPDFKIAWTYLYKALNIRNVSNCECKNLPDGEIAITSKALTDPEWKG